jgi:hypothetical protein
MNMMALSGYAWYVGILPLDFTMVWLHVKHAKHFSKEQYKVQNTSL